MRRFVRGQEPAHLYFPSHIRRHKQGHVTTVGPLFLGRLSGLAAVRGDHNLRAMAGENPRTAEPAPLEPPVMTATLS